MDPGLPPSRYALRRAPGRPWLRTPSFRGEKRSVASPESITTGGTQVARIVVMDSRDPAFALRASAGPGMTTPLLPSLPPLRRAGKTARLLGGAEQGLRLVDAFLLLE